MFGADDEPLRRLVGMRGQDVFFEGSEIARDAFEKEPKLLAAFGLALPAVVRRDRAFDLDAGREVTGDDVGGDTVGIGAVRYGGPGEKHAPRFGSARRRRKAGIRY